MDKLLKKLIPSRMKQQLKDEFRAQMKIDNNISSKRMPSFEFEQKHIANTRPLLTRKDLLEMMPKNAVVAEIGVDKGDFSRMIMDICSPSKLHLVDIWGDARYNQEKRRGVESMFASEITSGQVEINLGLSTDVVTQYADDYFDWIYIDTDHSYKTTYAELCAYAPKVKPGGIIAGHDYIVANWDGLVRYGVVEAVYQFCVEQNWELIHVTMENHGQRFPSFALKKI